MKTLDIITSAFNEEECLPEFFSRIDSVMAQESDYSYRLIVIDNGSIDATWKIIENQSVLDSRIMGLRMSRNFALDSAFTLGLDRANADAVIVMVSDLQDPPETIPLLLRQFEGGYDQVLVKILKRKSVPFVRRALSKSFYRIAGSLTGGVIPESVSDFRLMNRRAYEAVRSLRESHRFIRGLSAWVGFNTTHIEIERPPRFAGSSKWLGMPLLTVVGNSSRSILAYSSSPLSWVSTLGIFMSIGSFLLISALSIFWIVSGVPFPGFGSIIGVVLLGFSLTMLCIGVLAQYLALIYEEVKQRPLYIVTQETAN